MLFACNKIDPKSLLEIKKDYLMGTGSTLTSWKLKGLTVDSLPQILAGSQVGYIKKYLSTNNFTDSDGATGEWSLQVSDSLREVFNNYPSGIIVKQSYYISFLSYDSLSLTYLLNGKKINARFKALR
ncbi:MAG: hypothetical protein WBH12_00515 [Sediminibacterium sp.]